LGNTEIKQQNFSNFMVPVGQVFLVLLNIFSLWSNPMKITCSMIKVSADTILLVLDAKSTKQKKNVE
jgi:Na+/H+ antiporter NhaD/arsenite permease-like protein